MKDFDAVIVGAGPAGSSCAGKLVDHGLNVAVLEREVFPRTKLCAGWITPEVLMTLGLQADEYPHRFNTFDHLVVHVQSMAFTVRTIQHSIRRVEFDDFLLQRCGAERITHTAKQIRRENGKYVIDDRFTSDYLIGAGGTRCPVYKSLFRTVAPRPPDHQIVALEQEFPFDYRDPRCHLWFFNDKLPGYAWYVPKQNGYLNCGVGAMAQKLKQRSDDIHRHWRLFTSTLERCGLVRDFAFAPKGYSYYVRSPLCRPRLDNALLVGDAAGLSTVDLGEGIGPAVRSGQLAARAITSGCNYVLDEIASTSLDQMVRGRLLHWLVKRGLKRLRRG